MVKWSKKKKVSVYVVTNLIIWLGKEWIEEFDSPNRFFSKFLTMWPSSQIVQNGNGVGL